MSAKQINYINLINELQLIEKGDKESLKSILNRYNISKIEVLERKVLDYIFSINDDELRGEFIDMIAEDDILPIIHECYAVIRSEMSKDEYIAYQVDNVYSSLDNLNFKYNLCMKIISECSFLRKLMKTSIEYEKGFYFNSFDGINYINLIYDLKRAGRSDKQLLSSILYKYNIPKIESLERRVLDYIFSIDNIKLRYKLFNIIAESNNLPIIHECYCVIYSDIPKDDYITYQVKNVGICKKSLKVKYEMCMNIISQSSYLQTMKTTISKYKGHYNDDKCLKAGRILSHKHRRRSGIRD